MKRRTFLINATMTTGGFLVPRIVVDSSKRGRIGIVKSVFEPSGYAEYGLSNLKAYGRFSEAYADLQSGKIEALVSSPIFLSKQQSEFGVFKLHPQLAENSTEILEFHSQNGLDSVSLGALSPLKVRLSSLSAADNRNRIHSERRPSVVSAGVQNIWFEHMGFWVRKEKYLQRLTSQLVDIGNDHLSLTEAHAPALYLQSIRQNLEANISMNFLSRRIYAFVDNKTSASLPVEILFRKGAGESLQKEIELLRAAVTRDHQIQKEALELLQNQQNFHWVDSVYPEEMKNKISKYREIYLKTLESKSQSGLALIERSRRLEEIS